MQDSAALAAEITGIVIDELKKIGVEIAPENIMEVPVSVSGRHLHLSLRDLELLFGAGFELSRQKDISQPGQYASSEKVTLAGPKGKIENLRVLGPVRPKTQIELAASDARRIGLKLPVRASGDIANTPGCTLIGPKGSIVLGEGCIIAERHIHMTPAQAKARGVHNGQKVMVRIGGEKGGIFDKVFVHIRDDFAYDMHVDADDASAFMIGEGFTGIIMTD